MRTDPLIFLSAGEASGDHYGAELIQSLHEVLPQARYTGLGGTAMEATGQQRVIRAEDVAVMGITEILRHIPRILRSYRALVESVRHSRPDVAVLIDFPDVNFRLAKHLKSMGVPVLWFVSPQLWAWKRRRLRWVQSRVSKMLTIFPFEEPFYRSRGVDAEFVGHPLAEAPLPHISRQAYAEQHGLDAKLPWISLLPGSRLGELRANLPTMLQAIQHIETPAHYLLPIAPTLLEHDLAGCSLSSSGVHTVQDSRTALLHSRAAVVASGTATVQCAVIGTPFVVVYRVSRTTFRLAKRLVRYPKEIPTPLDEHGNLPIAMPNLIAGRRIVAELLQDQFTPKAVVAEIQKLLPEGPARTQQVADLAEVHSLLRREGPGAIARLREAVMTALNSHAG